MSGEEEEEEEEKQPKEKKATVKNLPMEAKRSL